MGRHHFKTSPDAVLQWESEATITALLYGIARKFHHSSLLYFVTHFTATSPLLRTDLHTTRMAAISNTDPLARVYREAFQRYKNLHFDGKLRDEHFELIKGQNTIEEVLYAVGKAKAQNKSERKAVHRVLRKTSKNLVGKLSRFESVVTTAIQSSMSLSRSDDCAQTDFQRSGCIRSCMGRRQVYSSGSESHCPPWHSSDSEN